MRQKNCCSFLPQIPTVNSAGLEPELEIQNATPNACLFGSLVEPSLPPPRVWSNRKLESAAGVLNPGTLILHMDILS